MPTSFFNNYYHWGKDLKSYFFYDYIKVISYVKYNTRKNNNLLFDKHHPNHLSKVQQPSISLKYKMFVAFIEPLSTNTNTKDIIKKVILK